MAQSKVISGSLIKVFVNNVLYQEVQSVSFEVDYGEYGIMGIDSPYPQEIASSVVTVRGNISGIRQKNSGGIQAYNLRPLYSDIAASPYVSIRIQDRQSFEDILFVANAKITNEKHSVAVKGTYKLSFDFIGQIPLTALDRS